MCVCCVYLLCIYIYISKDTHVQYIKTFILDVINRCPALILNRSYKCVYNQAWLFACSKWSNKSTIRWKIQPYWLMSLLELLWLQTNLDDFVTYVLPNESRADWQRLGWMPCQSQKGAGLCCWQWWMSGSPTLSSGPPPSLSVSSTAVQIHRGWQIQRDSNKNPIFPTPRREEERAGGAPSVLLEVEDVSVL